MFANFSSQIFLLMIFYLAQSFKEILNMNEPLNRRSFSSKVLSAPFYSLNALSAFSSSNEPTEKMTVVITGASSGIGLDAATKLSSMGQDVHILCRTLAKGKEAALKSGAKGYFECDLSSLQSVRNFAEEWGDKPIDVLCLNAGTAPATKGKCQYTSEGFEMAVGTNHMGHFLLSQLLLGNMGKSRVENPRLVVTASSVHDPDTPGGDVGSKATLGDLRGLKSYLEGDKTFDMVDGAQYDGDKSYKDSKLCNVLFTLEMERRLRASGSKVKGPKLSHSHDNFFRGRSARIASAPALLQAPAYSGTKTRSS
mmetsp:Transcript_5437/g.8203  ORF Transcript_5437/g.8203 Transcript_5437/m.8203 type:complete len:310 (+) Transcript_5437:31-960(+)